MKTLRAQGMGPIGALLISAAAGCGFAPESAPALLTIVDPALVAIHDSDVLPDSTRAAIRTYMGRRQDSAWAGFEDPELAQIVGDSAGITAAFNRDLLPPEGRTVQVLIDVPEIGYRAFEVTRVAVESGAPSTYTGQTRDGAISVLLREDTALAGRITTRTAVFSLRSGPYGLVRVAPEIQTGMRVDPLLLEDGATDVAVAQPRAGDVTCHTSN